MVRPSQIDSLNLTGLLLCIGTTPTPSQRGAVHQMFDCWDFIQKNFDVIWSTMMAQVEREMKNSSDSGPSSKNPGNESPCCHDSELECELAAPPLILLQQLAVMSAAATFAEAPVTTQPFYMYSSNDQFRDWWENCLGCAPIPHGCVLKVCKALQGHPEAPHLYGTNILTKS